MRLSLSISGNSEKLAVLLSRAIDMAGGLVFLKLVSTHASKEDMGVYLLATSIVALLLTVSFSALSQGVLRNVNDYLRNGDLAERYTGVLISFLLAAPIYAWLALNITKALGISNTLVPYIDLIVIWVASDALKTLNSTVAAAMRQRYMIASASVLDYCVKLGAVAYCIQAGRISTFQIILIMISASATVGLYFILMQKDFLGKTKTEICMKTLKESLHFSWPMMIWGTFAWLQNMSSRWIIDHYLGIDSVAAFGILSALGILPINAIFSIVATYIQPIVYEMESKGSGKSAEFILITVKKMVPILIIGLIVSIIFHREIIVLASSEKYADVSVYLPYIVISVMLSSLGSTLSYFVLAQRKGAALIAANTLPGILSVGFGLILIPRYGVPGAVATLMFTHLLLFLLLTYSFFAKKKEAEK